MEQVRTAMERLATAMRDDTRGVSAAQYACGIRYHGAITNGPETRYASGSNQAYRQQGAKGLACDTGPRPRADDHAVFATPWRGSSIASGYLAVRLAL